MPTTSSRDNWERLVAAVIKRDQIWQLCHQDSITTASSSSSEPDLRSLYNGEGLQSLQASFVWVNVPSNSHLTHIFHYDDFGLHRFSLHELRLATHEFSHENMVVRGSYSEVYKGRLADGSTVAVKRFIAEESEVMVRGELAITSIVRHRNVIGVRGFCMTKKEHLIVYPFMVNGSVSQRLRETCESQHLDWATRLRIALGVARGLAYLHHECIRGIIHRNVKAANVLLDEEFEAVLADFTLAKFEDCHEKDGIKGTIGHIDPVYVSTGKCSSKTDVYGYGVFLVELVTGQRTFDLARLVGDDDMTYLDWVRKMCEEKNFEAMVDRDLLAQNFVEEDAEKLLQISFSCTQIDPERRPTMPEVVRMLEVGYGSYMSTRKEFKAHACREEQARFYGAKPERTGAGA